MSSRCRDPMTHELERVRERLDSIAALLFDLVRHAGALDPKTKACVRRIDRLHSNERTEAMCARCGRETS
jgi:hypothetical protein